MNKFYLHRLIIFLAIIAFYAEMNGTGQTNMNSAGDSLVLDQVILSVIQSHPSIKAAEEALNAADAKIALAKSTLLPNIDAGASYYRVGPTPSLSFLNPFTNVTENIQLFPADNYSASLNFNETIYDFGKTTKSINYESESKKLAVLGIEQAKQKLSLLVLNTFFTLVYLQDGINIKKEQLKTLQEQLEFVQKKKATGSATEYEILTTQVKISGNESQLIDLETAFKVQLSVLNTLIGQPENTIHAVKKTFSVQMPLVKMDSMVNYAEQNRSEMKMAKQKETVSEYRYNQIKYQESPSVNVFASGGGKNGYVSDLNAFTLNYAVGLGIKVPIFDGTRKHNNLLQAASAIKSAGYETEIVHRSITNEVVDGQANIGSSQKKLDQAILQVTEAEKAFGLAKVSYQAGSITNLDLLDAATSLSESRLLLLKARIDNALSIYRLKLVLGERIY